MHWFRGRIVNAQSAFIFATSTKGKEMRFAHIKLIYILGISAVFSSTFALTQSASSFSEHQFSHATFQSPPKVESASSSQLLPGYGTLPLAFEVNKGQTNSDVKFLARRGGYTLFLTTTDAVLRRNSGNRQEPSLLRRKLADANKKRSVSGSGELPGKIN